LSGGKITLPFIYAFQNSSNEKKEILRNIIQNRKIEDFMILRDIILETNSIKLTQGQGKRICWVSEK
jgi:geranylgeranyl pyrophosphate synthase